MLKTITFLQLFPSKLHRFSFLGPCNLGKVGKEGEEGALEKNKAYWEARVGFYSLIKWMVPTIVDK